MKCDYSLNVTTNEGKKFILKVVPKIALNGVLTYDKSCIIEFYKSDVLHVGTTLEKCDLIFATTGTFILSNPDYINAILNEGIHNAEYEIKVLTSIVEWINLVSSNPTDSTSYMFLRDECITYDFEKDNIDDAVNTIIEEYHRHDVGIADILATVELRGLSVEDTVKVYARVYSIIEEDETYRIADGEKIDLTE